MTAAPQRQCRSAHFGNLWSRSLSLTRSAQSAPAAVNHFYYMLFYRIFCLYCKSLSHAALFSQTYQHVSGSHQFLSCTISCSLKLFMTPTEQINASAEGRWGWQRAPFLKVGSKLLTAVLPILPCMYQQVTLSHNIITFISCCCQHTHYLIGHRVFCFHQLHVISPSNPALFLLTY